jgi:chromosome segregation ATPase
MKAACIFFLVFGAFLASTGVQGAKSGDKTITKVVKLLQRMLDKSKKDADDDKEAYAKYKCYVDTNEADKTASIKKLTEQIDLLESKIAELQARNGELSTQTATLSSDMTENKAMQKSATAVRKASIKSFNSMEEDLEKGIDQMKEAISVLSSIALRQSQASVGKKEAVLLNMGSEVRNSLVAVSALLPEDKKQLMESFLQGTAEHSAKGDAITDILKKLKTTFEGNLKSAQDSAGAEKKAFEDSIETLDDSWNNMDKSLKEKNQEMGDNDDELGSKKTALEEATKQKGDDEDFLEKLLEMAAKKAKNYEERKMLRANEDAAIAECISILNSDEAFDTFGTTDATSTGATSFVQIRQLRGGLEQQQAQLALILERAASQGHNTRLARIAASVRTGHVFTSVMDEIKKMKETIVEEGTADSEQLSWCKSERTNSDADLDAKKSQIKTLNSAIDKLDGTINDPKTGLKDMITEKEAALVQNQKSQADETETRGKENKAYQEDVSNLASAEDILAKAIKVLNRYYDQLDEHMKENKDSTNLLQEDPAPPKTYGNFEGQSKSGGKAIDMLEFILKATQDEHSDADKSEASAQSDFDDSMTKLKTAETNMQKSLIKLKADLTEAEKQLLEKRSDLKDTTEAKEAIENYLDKIKPGCDFITKNFDLREKNRATETTALNKAVTLIKDTPAYKSAVAKDKELAKGKCKSECKLDTTSLDCLVCMSGSSKGAYCGKNPGTPGCK